jgi:hypothetical protein
MGLAPALLILAAALRGAPPAWAQAVPTVDQLEVVLWPEYDRPAVLVIYRVTLAAGTALPTQLTLPIPASVTELYAVASGAGWNDLFLANFTREDGADRSLLTIDVGHPLVQVEYYDDLSMSGTSRAYTFTWPGGVELGSMSYEVQTPFGATDMVVAPPGPARVGDDGLTYIEGDLGPQEASSSVRISFTYSKSTSGLTADVLQPTGPLEPGATAGGQAVSLPGWLPWAAGAAGVVLVVGGAILYWRINQGHIKPRPRTRRRPSRRLQTGEIDASPVFCHICGTQAAVSDRFCRRCGTRLRQ